jgi:hypothetical protein
MQILRQLPLIDGEWLDGRGGSGSGRFICFATTQIDHVLGQALLASVDLVHDSYRPDVAGAVIVAPARFALGLRDSASFKGTFQGEYLPEPNFEWFCQELVCFSGGSVKSWSAHLFGSLPISMHQRSIDQVLGDKPDLHLVRADDVADEQVVRTVVAILSRLPRHRPRLLEHDFMRLD